MFLNKKGQQKCIHFIDFNSLSTLVSTSRLNVLYGQTCSFVHYCSASALQKGFLLNQYFSR